MLELLRLEGNRFNLRDGKYITVRIDGWAYSNYRSQKYTEYLSCDGYDDEKPKYYYVEHNGSFYLLGKEPCYYA